MMMMDSTVTEIWHGLNCVSTSLFGGPGKAAGFGGFRTAWEAGSLKGCYCVWVWRMLPELISHSNSVGKPKSEMK